MKASALPRLILSAISLLLVLWLVKVDLAKTNPGEMSAVHAEVTTFLGQPDCIACHGKERQSQGLSSACLECHEAIAAQLTTGEGLHAKLGEVPVENCGQCHQEHHGKSFQLVSDLSFSLSGFAGLEAFDHRRIGLDLAGRHQELACQECHELADVKLLKKGQRRFLGLDRSCTACHDDPHEGNLGPDCASCHGQERPFDEVAEFEHPQAFPLEGVHAGMACLDCHAVGSGHEVSQATVGPLEVRACVACHDSPHTPDIDRTGQSCQECHGLTQGSFLTARERMTPELHQACGFSLAAPHDQVGCQDCHRPESASYATRFPGRQQAQCATCHEDPHGGQFLAANEVQSDCLQCHAREAFLPTTFDRRRHGMTSFPLEGAHAESDCANCHQAPTPEAPIRFRGLDSSCVDCHRDVHQGAFDATFAALGESRDCRRCHRQDRFDDMPPHPFDHGQWTGFALEGAHAEADCTVCHEAQVKQQRDDRQLAPVERLFPRHEACADCHADVHQGRFAKASAATLSTSQATCDRCHRPTSFTEVDREAFDHGGWTGFALQGAHARMDCSQCHLDARDDQGRGRRLGPVSLLTQGRQVQQCASCHQDPHQGAFDGPQAPKEVQGRRSCARCHDQESFGNLYGSGFDHGLWTGFALRGAHAQATCSSCHGEGVASASTGGSAQRVGSVFKQFPRLRPQASAACADCHQDPHGSSFRPPRVPASLNGKHSCDRCHGEQSFRISDDSFDHGRFTGFALEGAHAGVLCSSCHRPQPRDRHQGRSFAKAAGTACADCHRDPHAGQFRARKDCQACHRPVGDFKTGLSFDHQRDSRFHLDSTHAKLDCGSCHRDYRLANGNIVRRYIPLGTTCKDCHGFK